MKITSGSRLDPMRHVVPYKLLQVAHSLIENGQIEEYWKSVPVAKPPIGRVRFEVARQVATFAIPLLGLDYLHVTYGLKGVLLGLPVAWLAGYLLDRQLSNSIEKQRRRDCDVDRGRYREVNWLAEEMGMRREDVTLTVIRKMDADYHIVKRLIDEKVQQAEKEKAARRSAARLHRDREYTDENVAGCRTAASETYYSYEDEAEDYWPAVNPANGYPMISGTHFDIQGNAFGTG